MVTLVKSRNNSAKVEGVAKLKRSCSFGINVTFMDDAAPNSIVAAPSINAVPLPVTLPWNVMFAPFAHSNPEFSRLLSMTSPPLPVASSVPELTIVFAPVSISSELVPVAMIMPSLTRIICPAPNCPAPEIVLSTFVSVTSETVPLMTSPCYRAESPARGPRA